MKGGSLAIFSRKPSVVEKKNKKIGVMAVLSLVLAQGN